MRLQLRTIWFALAPAVFICCVVEGAAQGYWYNLRLQALQAVEAQGQLVLQKDVINFVKVADSVLGYKLAPNLDIKVSKPEIGRYALVVATTREGFMQREPAAIDRKPGSFRVIAVGDSATMGYDVDRGSFPSDLRRLLASEATAPGSTDVINAGVAGYISDQSALWAEVELARYRPDVVLLYSGFNDFQFYAPCDPPAQSSYFEQRYGTGGEFSSLSGLKSVALARALLAKLRQRDPAERPRNLPPREWLFSDWQAESGAAFHPDTSSSRSAPLISIPPGAFVWTASGDATGASGPYVAAVSLKGAGSLTVRVNGLVKPWPLYKACPVELTPEGAAIECGFTKPNDGMGLEIALINGSRRRVDVSAWDVNTHKPGETGVATACSDLYPPKALYAFFLRSLDRMISSFRSANPEVKILLSTLVGRWPQDTDEQFAQPDGHILWMAQNHLSRLDAAASLDRFNALIAEYAATNHLVLVDMAGTFSHLDRQRLMWSFAQMTNQGYEIMARTFYDAMLREHLVSQRPIH